MEVWTYGGGFHKEIVHTSIHPHVQTSLITRKYLPAMKPKVHGSKRISTLTLLLLAVALMPAVGYGQHVMRHPQPDEALGQKWQWAEEQARQDDDARRGYWIGYSIERLMGEYSFVGSWHSRSNRMTLHEVLYSEKPEFDYRDRRRGDKKSTRKVIKEVALLFEFEPGRDAPSDIRVTNVSGHVDLNGRPLFWLSGAEDDESLDFVQDQYRRTRSDDHKKDLVMAVAIHEDTSRIVPILTDILRGDDATDVRESAAFWLGQQDDDAALDVLRQAARNDRSHDVREQAVFGISQMKTQDATEALIDLARTGPHDIREDAVFWLGQVASDRAAEALGEVVNDDDGDAEVQKQAVFAISQLPPDQGVPMLIEIAKTHPRAKVRKDAIFWLGQSEDPRALEALIEMVRG